MNLAHPTKSGNECAAVLTQAGTIGLVHVWASAKSRGLANLATNNKPSAPSPTVRQRV